MTDTNQAKIDIYLSQPEVRMAIDMLSIKYNFVVGELAKSILEGELQSDEAAEFLVEEFAFELGKASELIDKLNENIIEMFYVEEFEEEVEIKEDEGPVVKRTDKKTNWKSFIKPKVLQAGMEELGKVSSGDVARVRNYLWKNLGLGKPEEVVVVLSWLAATGELAKLWQDDNRFHGIAKKYIGIKYTEELSNSVMSDKITPSVLGLSLRMTLEEKLGLSSQDSAMVSMSIIDQMPDEEKPKYILIAYVNAKDNSFNWNNIQESVQGFQLAM